VTAEDYIDAFDHWSSLHIHAAIKAGKDLAFRDRSAHFSLELDDDGAAWEYLLLEPGACPPPGHAWTVYRLHNTGAARPADPAPPPVARRRRLTIETLAERVFAGAFPAAKAKPSHLRAVT
jgi:hypothetical protein